MKNLLAVIALLSSFTPIAMGAAKSGASRFTLNDLLSVEPIGETALSPDGKTIALVREGQIFLMPSEGGWPVAITAAAGGKSGLSWSPDSRKLAYASQGSIWTIAAGGGQPQRLTQAAAGEGDPRQAGDRAPQWSPKGEWILFETGRRGHNSINVVNENGGTERFLTDSRADEVEASWSHDGRHISYTERSPEYFSGKLKVIGFDPAARTNDAVTLYTAPQDRGGGWSIRHAAWSPDDSSLAVVLQESGWDHVYLIPVSGGKPKPLTSGDYNDTDPVFSPDGKLLAVVSNRKLAEASGIWIVSLDGGSAKPLSNESTPGVESNPEWSPDGLKIYFHRSSPLSSTDLLVANLRGSGELKPLTHTLPRIFENSLQVPRKVSYKSTDDTSISALLYQPANFKAGTRYPTIFWIHGGPEAQDQYRLDLWAQYLAQEGYLVVEPNYRGSSGYGEKFRNLNVEDSGGGETDDVAAGVKYVINEGLTDPKRVAIGGGSHGGTMVAYAVTKYPALFQAAIEMYGVVDRATFLERTNRNSAVRWAMKMGGSPSEKPEVYLRANSLVKVKDIQTPLLLLHGENDPQVPPYESAQFAKALRQNNKAFYYFTYPGELHGFAQREHRLDAWQKELAFLSKYIKPRYGTSSTAIDDLAGAGLTRAANDGK
ncbi:MAG: S9 family peptidase [Acidobacteriaceae bacterium]|nr:S9 family peptidase [Acidobacteriaceae bacterium]